MSQNYEITEADELAQGGAKTKARANIAAIRLLQELEADQRQAAPDEQAVLVKFAGWGTMADLFTGKPEWADLQAELRSLVTDQEYAAARSAILNAHYTDPAVVGGIYKGLEHLGFQGGRILDPSMGANGVFEGLMPQAMRSASELTGVELDSLSGRIAKQLYPEATIHVRDFKDTLFPDSHFDLAISNVPFSEVGVTDPRYVGQPINTLHDYFFAKSLDKVRPGGLVAFLTSTGTMQSRSGESTREYLAERANLVGAIRLPNDAFRQMAGTDVTTDLIILQKRGEGIANNGIAWTKLQSSTVAGADGELLPVNEYYAQRSELMLGELRDDKLYPGRLALQGDGRNLAVAIEQAFELFPANIYQAALDRAQSSVVLVPPELQSRVKPNAYVLHEDKLYQRSGDVLEPVALEGKKLDRIRGMLEVRDATQSVFDVQLTSDSPEALQIAQSRLNEAYDEFASNHGCIHDRANKLVFQSDPDYPLLLALENYDRETKTATKTAVFSDRTIQAYQPKDFADTPKEALLYSLGEKGKVDLAYIAALVSSNEAEVIESLQKERLIFRDPQRQNWQPEDEYLSGNVRQKLELAKVAAVEDAQFQINVEALEAVQPELIPPGDIEVRLGSTWVPPADVADFVQDLLKSDSPIEVRYSKNLSAWAVEADYSVERSANNTSVYGTSRVRATRLVELALNLKDPVVYDPHPDDRSRTVKNVVETETARLKLEEVKSAFKDWVWRDPERTERLTARYNKTFNTHRPRHYNGAHLDLPGSNPAIILNPHQKDAVWRSLHGNTLLAHCCGAGKTFTMIASSQEQKRLGLVNKPMLVVPNHLLEQFSGDFKRLYPNANILAATKDDAAAANRQELMSRIATGTWDAVIVTHSAFGKLKLNREAQERFYNERIEQFEGEINELEASDSPASRRMVKELERNKKRLEANVDALYEGKGKDETVTFEQLGVDQLYVDEAHYFKNLGFNTKMYGVAGLPNTMSDRAFDLYMKTRYLAEAHGEGKGLVLATGTPIANTMAELYIMQTYLQAQALARAGLSEFDDWASTFGETVTAPEISPAGSYKVKTRFAQFVNVPELMNLFRDVADIQTPEMLNLPVPKLRTGQAEVVPCPASEVQLSFTENLAARAEEISTGKVDPRDDNMLLITTEGSKASLDMRLIHPAFPDDPNSKVNQFVRDAIEFYEATKGTQRTHLVFCDLGTPKEGAGSQRTSEVNVVERFSVYQDIKNKLIEGGMPAEKIAFVQDYKTDAKKLELQQKFSEGKIHLLISGAQLEVGFNGQKKLALESHLTPPWRPDQIEQRDFRILRQGNENAEVSIRRYVTQGRNNRPSFDAYKFQTLETKKKAIAQIMSGKSEVRSIEDVSDSAMTYAEVKAIATGNPLIMEKAEVDNRVSQLSMLRKSHLNAQYRIQQKLKSLPNDIDSQTEVVEGLRVDVENLPETRLEIFGKLSKEQPTDQITLRTVDVELINAQPEIDSKNPRDVGKHLTTAAAIKKAIGTKELEVVGRVGEFDLVLKPVWDSVGLFVRGEQHDHKCVIERSYLATHANLIQVFESLPQQLYATESYLNRLRGEFKDLSQHSGTTPFPKEAELDAALKRQKEINTALGLNKDNAVVTEEAIESGEAARDDRETAAVVEVVASSLSRNQAIATLLAKSGAAEAAIERVRAAIAPWDQQNDVASEAVAKLVYQSGLVSEMVADRFHLNVKNAPYPDLQITRADDRLSLIQLVEQNGESVIERQVVFKLELNGKLSLETAEAIDPQIRHEEVTDIAQWFCCEWEQQKYGAAAQATWEMQQQILQPSLLDLDVSADLEGDAEAASINQGQADVPVATCTIASAFGDIEARLFDAPEDCLRLEVEGATVNWVNYPNPLLVTHIPHSELAQMDADVQAPEQYVRFAVEQCQSDFFHQLRAESDRISSSFRKWLQQQEQSTQVAAAIDSQQGEAIESFMEQYPERHRIQLTPEFMQLAVRATAQVELAQRGIKVDGSLLLPQPECSSDGNSPIKAIEVIEPQAVEMVALESPKTTTTAVVEPSMGDRAALQVDSPGRQLEVMQTTGRNKDSVLLVSDADGWLADSITLSESGTTHGYQAAAQLIEQHEQKWQHPDLVALRDEFPTLRFESELRSPGQVVVAVDKATDEQVAMGLIVDSTNSPTPAKLEEFRDRLREKGYGVAAETAPAAAAPLEGDRLKEAIIEYFHASERVAGLSVLQDAMGYSKQSSATPLNNPVNQALRELRDTGRVTVSRGENEPCFELNAAPAIAAAPQISNVLPIDRQPTTEQIQESPTLQQMRDWLVDSRLSDRSEKHIERVQQLCTQMVEGTEQQQLSKDQRDPNFMNPKFTLSAKAWEALNQDREESQALRTVSRSDLMEWYQKAKVLNQSPEQLEHIKALGQQQIQGTSQELLAPKERDSSFKNPHFALERKDFLDKTATLLEYQVRVQQQPTSRSAAVAGRGSERAM